MHALFGFSGRMRRRSFALWFVLTILFSFVVGIAAAMVGIATGTEKSELLRGPSGFILGLGLAVMIYMQTALAAKRLKDAGWSGWFAAGLMVLMVLSTTLTFLTKGGDGGSPMTGIAYFVIIGWLAGARPSRGDNRYGPDPRGASPRVNIDPGSVRPSQSGAERAMDTLIAERSGERKTFGRRSAA